MSNPSARAQEFEDLMLAFFSEDLSPSGQARLVEFLEEEDYKIEFVEQLHLDHSLRQMYLEKLAQPFSSQVRLALEEEEAFLQGVITQLPPVKGSKKTRMIWGAAAAVILSLVCYFLLPEASLGHITSLKGELYSEGKLISKKRSMNAKSYSLQKGQLSLRLNNGVEMVLQAPCRFTAETEAIIHVQEGRFKIYVPPSGQNFTVYTKELKIVDLGTKFSLGVHREREVKVAVEEGIVEISTRNGQPSTAYQVARGEEFIMNKDGGISAPKKKVHFSVSKDPPAVDQADIAVLDLDRAGDAWAVVPATALPDKDHGQLGHIWSDRPAQGQTFTTSSHAAGYYLKGVSLCSYYKALPKGQFTISLGQVKDGKFYPILNALAKAPEVVEANHFITASFTVPVWLNPDSEYAFLWEASSDGFITLNQKDRYSEGAGITVYNPSSPTPQLIEYRKLDRIFHLDLDLK